MARESKLLQRILFGAFVTLLCSGMIFAEKLKKERKDGELPLEDSFVNIQKMDDQECIPRLLCEMAASSKKVQLSKEETTILNVFDSEKTIAEKNGKSPLSVYKFAIEMGKNSSEELRCQNHYSKCPLTGKDLLSAFKSIIVSKI